MVSNWHTKLDGQNWPGLRLGIWNWKEMWLFVDNWRTEVVKIQLLYSWRSKLSIYADSIIIGHNLYLYKSLCLFKVWPTIVLNLEYVNQLYENQPDVNSLTLAKQGSIIENSNCADWSLFIYGPISSSIIKLPSQKLVKSLVTLIQQRKGVFDCVYSVYTEILPLLCSRIDALFDYWCSSTRNCVEI